jgi:hypothetical protein
LLTQISPVAGSDDVEDVVGVGEHGDVAAVYVAGGGAHALRHEALLLGADGTVAAGCADILPASSAGYDNAIILAARMTLATAHDRAILNARW